MSEILGPSTTRLICVWANHNDIRRRLLAERNLTFKNAIVLVKALENAEVEVKLIDTEVKTKKTKNKKNTKKTCAVNQRIRRCYRCNSEEHLTIFILL